MTDTRYLVLRKDRLRAARGAVRCCDQPHEIVLTDRGQLVLTAHDVGRELRLMELGGRECRCMEVLRLWRGKDLIVAPVLPPNAYMKRWAERHVPKALLGAYQRRWDDRVAREHFHQARPDPYLTPLLDRPDERTVAAVREALGRCDYPRDNYHRGEALHEAIHRTRIAMCLRGGDHHCRIHVGVNRTEAGIFGLKVETNWEVLVPLLWYQRVYRRNLAVLDGCFVMRVLCPSPLRVVAVRHVKDFLFEARAADVRQGRGGPGLCWRTEEGP